MSWSLDAIEKFRVDLLKQKLDKILHDDSGIVKSVVVRPGELSQIMSELNYLKRDIRYFSNEVDNAQVSTRLKFDNELHNLRKKYEKEFHSLFAVRDSCMDSVCLDSKGRLSREINLLQQVWGAKIADLKAKCDEGFFKLRSESISTLSIEMEKVKELKNQLANDKLILKEHENKYRKEIFEKSRISVPIKDLIESSCISIQLDVEKKRHALLKSEIRNNDLYFELLIS